MWFYTKKADAIETLTCLETGAQVIRSGEGEHSELWWRGNVITGVVNLDIDRGQIKKASQLSVNR